MKSSPKTKLQADEEEAFKDNFNIRYDDDTNIFRD